MLRFMRLFGDGKHGLAERIQTFRCQACHNTFTARRDTPLYRLKTPSRAGLLLCSLRLSEGLDASAAARVFGYRQTTITTWLSRAGEHAQSLHEHFFHTLQIPHLQLDELRTRLRCASQVLWLWLAIDPLTKILPVTRARPPHAIHGPSGHPLAPTEPGRLSVSRSLPVMGSISTSLLSRPILVTGWKRVGEGAPCAGGRWRQA